MHGCPIGNLILELSCQDEDIRQRLHDTFTSWAEAIEAVLHYAVAAGELPALDTCHHGADDRCILRGRLMLAKTQNDPDVVQRLAHGAMRLVEALYVRKDVSSREGVRKNFVSLITGQSIIVHNKTPETATAH